MTDTLRREPGAATTSSEAFIRQKQLIASARETLADYPVSNGTDYFILSPQDSEAIGIAVSTRNQRQLRNILEYPLDSFQKDFIATQAEECIGEWNTLTEKLFGDDITLGTLLDSPDGRELLNSSLTDSEATQLGLDTTSYLKLLETVAVATMHYNGFSATPTRAARRTGHSVSALHNRSIQVLDTLASHEPGVRDLRQSLNDGDPDGLENYMSRLNRARGAQNTLARIVELNPHEIATEKQHIATMLHPENDQDAIELLDEHLFVLDWTMLKGSERDSSEDIQKRIYKIIEAQSETKQQKSRLYQNWCPERIDFLIEIALQAQSEQRNPELLISNRFEEGAGVYIAVVTDHPKSSEHKIVFADNPLSGNALYIVDEVKLENEGRPNHWTNVLGSSRRVARERGAFRKYHTKNFYEVVSQILQMGDELDAAESTATEQIFPESIRPTEDIISETRALISELYKTIEASRQ